MEEIPCYDMEVLKDESPELYATIQDYMGKVMSKNLFIAILTIFFAIFMLPFSWLLYSIYSILVRPSVLAFSQGIASAISFLPLIIVGFIRALISDGAELFVIGILLVLDIAMVAGAIQYTIAFLTKNANLANKLLIKTKEDAINETSIVSTLDSRGSSMPLQINTTTVLYNAFSYFWDNSIGLFKPLSMRNYTVTAFPDGAVTAKMKVGTANLMPMRMNPAEFFGVRIKTFETKKYVIFACFNENEFQWGQQVTNRENGYKTTPTAVAITDKKYKQKLIDAINSVSQSYGPEALVWETA